MLAALVLGALLAAPAEEGEPRTVSVLVGLRADATREDLLVPLGFGGPGLTVGLRYQGALGPGLLEAQGLLGLSVLWNRFGQVAATITPSLQAAWLLPLPLDGAWRLFLGPELGWDTRLDYLYRWDDAHGYWVGAQWLGPALRLAGPVGGGWRLELEAALALLGLLGRPPPYRFTKQEAVDHLDYWLVAPLRDEVLATPATLQLGHLAARLRPPPGVAPGWSFALLARLEHATVPAGAVGLGLAACVSRDWAP